MMNNIEIVKINGKNNVFFTTKGLKNTINKEIAINVPLDEELATYIINKTIENIENGLTINNKDFNDEILTCKIYYVMKDDNIVIVFPDVKMKYPWDEGCQEVFLKQI